MSSSAAVSAREEESAVAPFDPPGAAAADTVAAPLLPGATAADTAAGSGGSWAGGSFVRASVSATMSWRAKAEVSSHSPYGCAVA
jgi:hypothetical protein